MKKIVAAVLCVMIFSGCGNLSPKMQERIDNQNGKIDEIKNNQNGIMNEMGTIKSQNDFTNSKMKEYQEGLFNLNAKLSSNENSGIQILQGDGALVLVFGLGVIALILLHYRKEAKDSQKAAEIIADQVAQTGDPDLKENIFKAASYTEAEGKIFHLMTKNNKKQ